MARPDPALLDPARYPFACEVPTRFADLDVNRHLNNVALAGMVEEGRVRFHQTSGFVGALRGLSAMVASMRIEFIGQGFYPQPVTAHAGAARIGRSSYALDLLLMQEGRTVAFAESVIVCVKDGVPTALPQGFRDTVNDWMIRA